MSVLKVALFVIQSHSNRRSSFQISAVFMKICACGSSSLFILLVSLSVLINSCHDLSSWAESVQYLAWSVQNTCRCGFTRLRSPLCPGRADSSRFITCLMTDPWISNQQPRVPCVLPIDGTQWPTVTSALQHHSRIQVNQCFRCLQMKYVWLISISKPSMHVVFILIFRTPLKCVN